MFEINRTYAKRATEKSEWSGEIARVAMAVTAPAKGKIVVTLDGQELPEASVEHLLYFALQSLQDAYAGAKSMADAKEAFAAKYDRLREGTLGTRSGGDGASEATRIARRLVLAEFKIGLGEKWKESAKWKEFDALDDDEQNAKLDAAYAKNEAHFAPKVAKEQARLAEQRAAKAKLRESTVSVGDLGL